MLQKFILTYGIFIMTIVIDFVSKKIAITSATYFKNEGIMMSAFAHLPLMIKSVYLCTIGIFLLAIYILITFYFNFKTKKFYVGTALLFAGFTGNVLDRIQFGYVVDFFQILQLPVFNFADMAQIIGIIFVIWSWKTELDFHLPLDNKRTFSPFNRSLDVRFTIQLFILFLCSTMIVFSFSYLFIKYSLVQTGLASGLYLEEHLQAYVIMFFSFIFFSLKKLYKLIFVGLEDFYININILNYINILIYYI
jgi:signal peptidase II